MSKFLLLLGPSGVGKTTIIHELRQLDNRFVYISPYMTRPLREGEKDKVPVSGKQMDEMQNRGELLAINQLFDGIRYGTPRAPIAEALAKDQFPVLDWPIEKIDVMTQAFPGQLYVVYVSPPSIEILRQRLALDGRDKAGIRLQNARKELEAYWSASYDGVCDFEIISENGHVLKIAYAIYTRYLASLCL